MSDIVVGMDASANAAAALRWAVRDARLRGARVRAVLAWAAGSRPPELDEAACSGSLDHLARSARRLLHQAVGEVPAEAAREDPPVEVVEHAVYSTPAHALLDASLDAQMVVVGSRPRPATGRVFVSSVGDVCAHEASVPVVVVRGDAGCGDGCPILVGVDGSAPSVDALRWAARAAALRRVPLHVLHACAALPPARLGSTARGADPCGHDPRSHDPHGHDPHSHDPATDSAVRKTLECCIAECRPETAGLEIHVEIAHGGAAASLIAAAVRAQLLVVGARGYGGFAGLQLGSTSHECVARARCPVAVVRTVADNPPAWRGGSFPPAQKRADVSQDGPVPVASR